MKSYRILIVDDEPLIRRAFTIAGTTRGHTVETASKGEEAIKSWLFYTPDLVFLDMLLPDMSGFQVLKKLPETLNAKCVMISANDDFERYNIENKKIHLFVKKPFKNIFEVIEMGERLIFSKEDTSLSI